MNVFVHKFKLQQNVNKQNTNKFWIHQNHLKTTYPMWGHRDAGGFEIHINNNKYLNSYVWKTNYNLKMLYSSVSLLASRLLNLIVFVERLFIF